MDYGYSERIVKLNKKADATKLGVKVGRVCIRKGIPVAVAAEKFGVSRQTLYNWICGITEPHQTDAVAEILATLR